MVADANRRGYRHLLDAFWDDARCHGVSLPTEEPVSAASFCSARHKITVDLLRHMLHELASTFFDQASAPKRWLGRRVFAVDGTKLNLQRAPDLRYAFGVPDGTHCPQALVSVLLDVCAKAPVDLVVSGFASSEREHLLDMLPSLARGDVLVLDRGYPSHEVLQELVQQEIDFVVRVPASHTFTIVDELHASRGDDYLFHLDPPEGAPPKWRRLTLRAVRLRNHDGEESFFLTSLRRESVSRAQLRRLYHMRWEAEEFFKLLKGPYIGQGQFRSKSSNGVVQEIHALVLYLAIARVLMATAAETSDADYDSLSQKAAVLGLAAYVVRILLPSDQLAAHRDLEALLRRIVRTRQKRRPGRSAPRRSYRPRLRWGPSGRCRG